MVIIRPFQADDMFSVIKMASETLTEQYQPSLFNSFYELFPNGFIVAEYHHTVIGFIVGITITKEHGRILMLSVKPSYQRKKIGSQLLSALITVFKHSHIKQITLEVKTDNTSAMQFYQHHHFHLIDTIENFYQNGENAFILRREVQPE